MGLPALVAVPTVLAPSERYAQERGRQHKKLTDWARQGLLQAARWLPGRRIIAVTDSGYAALDLPGSVRRRLSVVTRLRLDARLFDPVPPRKRRAVGRPRTVGRRQPTLAYRLADPHTRWQAITVANWYGGEDRRVEIATGTAIWQHLRLRQSDCHPAEISDRHAPDYAIPRPQYGRSYPRFRYRKW